MSSDKGRPRRRPDDWDDYEDEVQEEEYMPPAPVRRRRPQAAPPPPVPRPRTRRYETEPPRLTRREPPRQRSVWPWLLMGCAGGILLLVLAAAAVIFFALRSATGSTGIGGLPVPVPGVSTGTYTEKKSSSIPVANLQQIQVHNQTGDVTIAVDPSATTATVSYIKKVKAASSDDANKEFNNIVVQVQPPVTTDAPLIVSATVPNNGTLFGSHSDFVDVMITLPPQGSNPLPTPTTTSTVTTTATPSTPAPLKLDVNVPIGNITITGLNGILQIQDGIGNIMVQQATLFDGSSLRTSSGNVTFSGSIDSTILSGRPQSIYTLQSETGNLNVTLPAATDVILDAYTNNGNITSDFDVSTIKSADGSLNGPLVAGTSPKALLKLHVSTGNVVLRKSP